MVFDPFSLVIGVGLTGFNWGINQFISIASRGLPPMDSIMPALEPRIPQIAGTNDKLRSSLTYGFDGPLNSTSDGLAVPDLGGKLRIGGQVIGYYLSVSDSGETVYILIAIAQGEVSAVVYSNSTQNIWISKTKRLSDCIGAEFQTREGSNDQSPISWFDAVHQLRELDIDTSQRTKLLLHFNTGPPWVDDSIYAKTLTNHNCIRITPSPAKFLTAASFALVSNTLSFFWIDLTNGTAAQNGAFDLGSSDFTIDVWINPRPVVNYDYMIMKWEDEADNSGYYLYYRYLNDPQFAGHWFEFCCRNGEFGTWYRVAVGHVASMTTSAWHHLEVSRTGATFFVFLDGVDVTSPNISTYWGMNIERPSNPTTKPALGKSASLYAGTKLMYDWRGYMDEFRLTKGTVVHTANFIPPTAAYEGWENKEVKTRGNLVDKVSLIFEFPNGLFSQSSDPVTGEMVVSQKSVEFDIQISRSDWGGYFQRWKGEYQKITGSVIGLIRRQMDFIFDVLLHTAVTGTFATGDLITGSTSGRKAKVAMKRWPVAGPTMHIVDSDGTFIVGETITGSPSGATGTVTALPQSDASQWTVRILRRTDDDFMAGDVSSCSIIFIDEVYRKSLAYPGTALLALKVPYSNSTSSSSLEDVSLLAEKGNVTISTWGTRDVSDPPYKMLDILCNKLGVSASRINSASIAAWSTYCTTLIGSNRRCRFNGIFDTLGVADDAVNAILKVGRASLLKSNEYKVVIDTIVAESAFTGLFTGGNIVEDTFSMQWTGRKDRPHAVTVEYHDQNAEYERKAYTYYGAEYNLTTEPLRIDRDFLLGCTLEDEAKRYAILRYQLKRMSSATCSFEVGIDAVNCEPGDVIWVQPLRSRKTFGGRVIGGTSTAITVDQSITLDSATYGGLACLWFRHTNGVIDRRMITGPFDSAVTTFAVPALSYAPGNGCVYGIGRYSANVSPIDMWRWRVVSMSRGSEGRILLDCMEYNARAYYHADYGSGATII